MDDSGAWAELQRLAQNAHVANEAECVAVTYEDINRWVTLFNYSPAEAKYLIETQRSDINKDSVSDAHWDLIRHRFEPAGYDKEAYEHAQTLEDILKTQSTTIQGLNVDLSSHEGQDLFVFRLGGMLDTPEKVQAIAKMDLPPRVIESIDESGVVELCMVGHEERLRIQDWLRSKRLGL